MTSITYFLLFFISWQQFKATPHSCSFAVLLCMMKNRWGTQIYKLLQPISIYRAWWHGLGLEWRLFNVQTWSREVEGWWGTFLTLSRHQPRHSDTYSPCQNITVKGSPLRLSNKNKPPASNCLAARSTLSGPHSLAHCWWGWLLAYRGKYWQTSLIHHINWPELQCSGSNVDKSKQTSNILMDGCQCPL